MKNKIIKKYRLLIIFDCVPKYTHERLNGFVGAMHKLYDQHIANAFGIVFILVSVENDGEDSCNSEEDVKVEE